tara:strand:+ start:81026 stop:81334 length:309 start_codon:yes stop_codon:yes gene_type:complete
MAGLETGRVTRNGYVVASPLNGLLDTCKIVPDVSRADASFAVQATLQRRAPQIVPPLHSGINVTPRLDSDCQGCTTSSLLTTQGVKVIGCFYSKSLFYKNIY